MQNVTILVNSCDSREDAWTPFFALIKAYWKDCPYDFVLNTETKNYECDFFNVKVVNTGYIPWGKRLRTALNEIDSEYIVYFLEDFFIMRDVNTDSFNEALSTMKKDSSIGFIGLKYNETLQFRNPAVETSNEHFVSKDDLVIYHRVNNQAGLWRKDYLLSLIKDHETPWEFDNYASMRSLRTDKKILLINNMSGGIEPVFDYGVDVQYGYGIYKGKWLKNNKELFEKNDIYVDFERLGWYIPEDGDTIGDSKKQTIARKIKVRLSIIKKRIKSKIRAWRSLH